MRERMASCESTIFALVEDANRMPWKFDLFMLLRWVDAKQSERPRLGTAVRPNDEAVRLGQTVSMQFAPANVDSVEVRKDTRISIKQRGFGLFGPNGPLPIHLTEYALERAENFRDRSLTAFADIFHHRLLLLFYRAWADVQATVSMDRRSDDRFGNYVSSVIGYGEPSQRGRDSIPENAKRHYAGHIARTTRNPEGLVSILSGFFRCPVSIEERQFQWLALRDSDRTSLGSFGDQARLGFGAICGAAVPDRAHRFRVRIGPLNLTSYEQFLPTGLRHIQIRDWIRNYISLELSWDVCLILRADEVPAVSLGGGARLGWTTWLGQRTSERHADDLILDVESRSEPELFH